MANLAGQRKTGKQNKDLPASVIQIFRMMVYRNSIRKDYLNVNSYIVTLLGATVMFLLNFSVRVCT